MSAHWLLLLLWELSFPTKVSGVYKKHDVRDVQLDRVPISYRMYIVP